jgi:hypothetical protein
MSRFLIFVLGAILGTVLGGALIFYFFVGPPRAAQVPGAPIKSPDVGGLAPGTATVVLNQQFFDTVLGTIFREMNAPAFPLNFTGRVEDERAIKFASFQGAACDSQIILKPEGSGVTTGVRFENGEISAPLAFSGSTSLFGNCLNFTGWAQTKLDLRYDEQTQNVFGQINVQTVNLDGAAPLSGLITPVVQTTLNNRVNPIEVLRGQQIALNLPIRAAEGNLQATVKDVRAEVKDNALHLYITYNFTGTRSN